MQTFGAFLVGVLAASSELVSALPSQMDMMRSRGAQPGSATVQVKPRAATTYKHPALAAARAVNKFQKEMPAHLDAIVQAHRGTSSTKKRAAASGSATNTPEAEDEAYLVNVAIGTPAQTLPLDFDTGSSDLWVFSSLTASNEINGQKTYDVSTSTSAKKMTGATWSISYGDGSSSSGDVYTDTVTVGNLTFASQAVEAATTVSDEFTEDSSSSGLLGLAMSDLNTVTPTQQKTFFDNIKSTLSQPIFVADLNHDEPGTYTFGAMNFDSTVYYANLDNQTASLAGYWTFEATGYGVGNGTATTATDAATTNGGHKNKHEHENAEARAVHTTKQHAPISARTVDVGKRSVALTDTSIVGIADTGTTLLMLPDDVVSAYYSQVSGAQDSTADGGYVFPCSADMPDFSFGVGKGAITVPGSYINWAPVDSTGTTCYGGMQSDSSIGFSIFGDIALKSAYVVFDSGEGRVGWAQKAAV